MQGISVVYCIALMLLLCPSLTLPATLDASTEKATTSLEHSLETDVIVRVEQGLLQGTKKDGVVVFCSSPICSTAS